MKAIEAAARALRELWPDDRSIVQVCDLLDGEADALASIAVKAYLTALAEDDAAVEAVARAIHANWEVKKKGKPSRLEHCPPNTQEAFRSDARAAIRAMGGERWNAQR